MAKPKLALIPAAQGTKFYSVLPSDGSGDFTFTRGSVATRINAQGLIENVASGQSRLDYPLIDGVQKGCPHHILEPASTNLATYSEDFSNAVWTKDNCTISQNVGIAPDGTTTADKLIMNNGVLPASPDQFGLKRNSSVASGIYSYSFFAKAAEFSSINIREIFDSGLFLNINLINGVITNPSPTEFVNPLSINVGNGWYRISWTSSVMNNILQYIVRAGATGDGTSGFLIWGYQVEAQPAATSYIPTNGESGGVTRSAETANGAGNSTTFNDAEGVLMAEISALSNDTSSKTISLTDGGQTNGIELFFFAGNSIYINLWSGGVSQGFLNYEIDIENFNKVCYTYKLNNTALWINGYKVDTDTSATMPIGLSELAFESGIGGNDMYCKTKQLQYFDSALADTQLEQLTSWQSFRDMANGQLYTIE